MKDKLQRKPVAIFGATGSIGRQSLEVIEAFPGRFKVTALTGLTNEFLLKEQAKRHHAKAYMGLSKMREIISGADYIINAIPGFAGLEISSETLHMGKTLLPANKESLAIGGRWLKEIARANGGRIYPLDSEASAVWQLIDEHGVDNVDSVDLTCSGGPFFGKTAADLAHITVEDALAHPTWKMGPKVSVDSATLINKLLEVYEVHNLFGIPLTKINILIHRESLAHGIVHLHSGARRVHAFQPDMRLFISYALNYPQQPISPWKIKRCRKSDLKFLKPDTTTFRPISWLRLHKENPNFPIILNAANDVAVSEFLAGRLPFLGIYDLIEKALEKFLWLPPPASFKEMVEFHCKITDEIYEYCHPTRGGSLKKGKNR
ncbi:MAG: 1-deoxy-D-xylulose-5-phosphate reductoisomerase [Candidatus Gracilibacteria bacterium]|jgi:1-deoxy-D-xylulose-5-phosphate reductoisomerase